VKVFEVVVVEDGSIDKADEICASFSNRLNIKYFYKENSGPGSSRNYGCERAAGDYFIFLDSDIIVPPDYLKEVEAELLANPCDAFGGPDAAHPDFTIMQKAINYSMTSVLTTGGIRGKSNSVEKFHPRSFNMGISRQVYESTRGFSKMRFGEDIDLSIRIVKSGFSTRLFPKAFVYHKRRNNLRSFYKQINNSGIARINLYLKHPESLKLFHFLPAIFALGVIFLLLMSILWDKTSLIPLLLLMILIFFDSTARNKCIRVGFLSILTVFVQHFAYGLGFIKAWWLRILLKKKEFQSFSDSFYK